MATTSKAVQAKLRAELIATVMFAEAVAEVRRRCVALRGSAPVSREQIVRLVDREINILFASDGRE